MSEEHKEQVEEPDVQQADASNEVEEKAREKGWRPQDEWTGEGWLPAEDYLKRGSYKDRARRAEEQVAELQKVVEAQGDSFKRLERMSEVALKQQRKQLEGDFATRKREAVKLGDEDAYDKAERDEKKALDELDKEHADTKPKEETTGIPAVVKAKLEAWVEDNQWFVTEPRLRRHAERFYDDVEEDMPAASVEDKLAETRERMVQAYPDKFGVKRTNGAARVEGGSRTSGSGTNGGSLYSQMPREAKEQADKFIKEDGRFLEKGETADKDLAKARERYAKIYLEL